MNPETGETTERPIMNVERVVERMVKTMEARERGGRNYGVIVIAEGLAEFLPSKHLEGISRDEHGHISIANVNLGRMMSKLVADALQNERLASRGKSPTTARLLIAMRANRTRSMSMLGSQIGVGAFRALVEKKLNGVMISVGGQLDLSFVPFEQLVDPKTLVTKYASSNRTATSIAWQDSSRSTWRIKDWRITRSFR